ncbi:heparinase II/III domain-containing protein [Pseudoduganella lutea]|uniref:Heparinase II/III-like C-terminal domain-containing protein n=1 Tax=Pseudoduganella lutea TaxID=321985 RepID=A0A4P6KV09_9BURK|nr:heparinase II/III family protein [Pseudoduganella lutea]QBE62770.1 hypothetical protein EWM63_07145 [Pseudoduganella lutea]
MPRMRLIPMLTMAAVATIGSVGPASALDIRTDHPRLYATASDFAALKAEFPTNLLPANYGTVVVTLKPGARDKTRDLQDAIVFGNWEDSSSHLFIRHIDGWDTAGTIGYQVGFKTGPTTWVVGERVDLRRGETASIKMHYNGPDKFLSITVTGGTLQSNGGTSRSLPGTGWAPDPAKPQKFYFVSRVNEEVVDIKVLDGENREKWSGANLDWTLQAAHYRFIDYATKTAAIIQACSLVVPTSNSSSVCNVATGNRAVVTQAGADMGLAYQLTGESKFGQAAQHYVKLIGTVPVESNGEWSMGARVGALALIYDWLYAYLPDADKSDIRRTIIDTVRKDITGTNSDHMDLIGMACGNQIGLKPSTATIECASTADISRFYISGHNGSANHATALGLLAIADGETKAMVMPMIDTLHRHQAFKVGDRAYGFLPTREYISQDGGHHSLFAYGSGGELLQRVRMWNTVQPTGTDALINEHTKFAPKLIKPYIYALRKGYSEDASAWDGTFPPTGDYFDTRVTDSTVGYMALGAANAGDGVSTAFHKDYVQRGRSRLNAQALWERLYFPGTRAPAQPNNLPLAAHFAVAGNVFMRDTWLYDEAVLLDFKSTSFASENHQHLDQNSFSLFYKAPLLVDSGWYDAYYSSHWENYNRRTIAHNTIVVYDPLEKFERSGTTFSNDGGQWYKGYAYPTLDEVKPGGTNALDGVTVFEDTPSYAYTSGNASKAYKSGVAEKLHHVDGFRRNIIYLRQDGGKKPIIVVHDRINSPKKLPATSLLHSVTRPETFGSQIHTGTAGIYSVNGSRNAPLRIRNGDGMVTVDPVLPRQATIRVVGGTAAEGHACEPQVRDVEKTTEDRYDCRFNVRQPDGTWANYPPRDQTDASEDRSDIGNWRIEIEGAPGWQYQNFMNVLRVEPNDHGTGVPEVAASQHLPSSDFSVDAVALDASQSVAFATKFGPADKVRFDPLDPKASVLVAGLVPNAYFSYSPIPGSEEYAVVQESGPGTGRYLSSPKGVLKIPAR